MIFFKNPEIQAGVIEQVGHLSYMMVILKMPCGPKPTRSNPLSQNQALTTECEPQTNKNK